MKSNREMTGRERALRAMNFEATDRLAIMRNGLGSHKYIQNITGLSEKQYWADQPAAHYQAMRILGQDFDLQKWFPPRQEADRSWSRAETPAAPDLETIVSDMERTTAKLDGQLMRLSGNSGECEKNIKAICDYQVNEQKKMGDDLLWIFGMDAHGPACLGFPYGQYGYDGFFLVCGLHPEVMEALWRAQARLARWHNECVAEAARRLDWPRIGYLGDDMTEQRGNMISPKMMAERFFPHLDHALQPLVEAGFKLIWHSDGNMNDMIGPLIDIGMAGFQGFQEECGTRIADVAKLRNRNGDPLILWGSFSVTRVLRTGSFNDIRREVQRILDEWPHPGLCLATSSYISPDVPEENITELYRCFREVRRK